MPNGTIGAAEIETRLRPGIWNLEDVLMISLLYHSHTVVPAHLAELETLGLVEPDEQILVALDGVLLDSVGQRLSGPTLHDYCLLSSLRIILWARDYGRHLCLAFPLAELTGIEGAGVDPLHAQIQLTFTNPDEDAQQFTLALLPLANLPAALQLLRSAAEAARTLADHGVDAREGGPEILAILSEQIYGHADGPRPGEAPYRWPGAAVAQPQSLPSSAFAQDPASLPPGQFYAAGRLARSAWDTLRRSIREADLPLPIELNGGSLRELTEAVRAINDLVHTVATNPSAQQMAMAFLHRQNGTEPRASAPPAPPPTPDLDPPAPSSYHEIPLRRRGVDPSPPPVVAESPRPRTLTHDRATTEPLPDHREIPLRRRSGAPVSAKPFLHSHRSPTLSGSGDAGVDERLPLDDRHG